MSKIEITAIIILIITVVCLIVLPRLYYRKKRKNFTNNPIDTIAIINAIYTAAAVQIGLIIGILGGLIISLRRILK